MASARERCGGGRDDSESGGCDRADAEGAAKKAIARALEKDIQTVRHAIKSVWKRQLRTRKSKIEAVARFFQQRFEEIA